jgi:hypothetical protein
VVMSVRSDIGENVMPDNGAPQVLGYVFVQRGTSAAGWSRSPDLLYVCESCGTSMPAAQDTSFGCSCGAMRFDNDAGRFGSKLGDDAILTYRKRG